MKCNLKEQSSKLFKTTMRIGYFLVIFILCIIAMVFQEDEIPVWLNVIIKVFAILYLLLGMLISYIYEIPIFNPLLSSWFEQNYKIDIKDFVLPIFFIICILAGPF